MERNFGISSKEYFDRTAIKPNGASLRVMTATKISSLFLVSCHDYYPYLSLALSLALSVSLFLFLSPSRGGMTQYVRVDYDGTKVT